jgi:hypothetical protein
VARKAAYAVPGVETLDRPNQAILGTYLIRFLSLLLILLAILRKNYGTK